MVFKRRTPLPFWPRMREMLAPRKGWRRGISYLSKRVKRLPDSPHNIALGFACGAVASFTPFFGFHFFVAAGLAWVVRANIWASLAGTAVGNPLTFPFIATLALGIGRSILGAVGDHGEFDQIIAAFGEFFVGIWDSAHAAIFGGPTAFEKIGIFFHDVFLPYLVGGIAPGLATGAACYVLLRPIVATYQRRRKLRFVEGAKRRVAEARSRAADRRVAADPAE